jgi:hypothetical protein
VYLCLPFLKVFESVVISYKILANARIYFSHFIGALLPQHGLTLKGPSSGSMNDTFSQPKQQIAVEEHFVDLDVKMYQLNSLKMGLFRAKTCWRNSNKSPTRCNNFPVYYPDVYLQLNMFWAFSRPSSRAQ